MTFASWDHQSIGSIVGTLSLSLVDMGIWASVFPCLFRQHFTLSLSSFPLACIIWHKMVPILHKPEYCLHISLHNKARISKHMQCNKYMIIFKGQWKKNLFISLPVKLYLIIISQPRLICYCSLLTSQWGLRRSPFLRVFCNKRH